LLLVNDRLREIASSSRLGLDDPGDPSAQELPKASTKRAERLCRPGGSTAALAAILLAVSAVGCRSLSLFPRQEIVLNGRSFLFDRVDSIRPGSGALESFAFDRGAFFLAASGPVLVNGVEIRAHGPVVEVANQRLELPPGERLCFDDRMDWFVDEGAARGAGASLPGGAAQAVPASFQEAASANGTAADGETRPRASVPSGAADAHKKTR
jgi:hypothetical protein